jgi:hypothetical protein
MTFVVDVVGRQGSCGGCVLLPEMQDAAKGGLDRANNRAAAPAVLQDFAAYSILLVGERVGNMCGRTEVAVRSNGEVEAPLSQKNLHVL